MSRHVTLNRSLVSSAIAAALLYRLSSLSAVFSIVSSFSSGLILWVIYRAFIYPFYFSPLRHIPTVPGNPLWGHAPARLVNEVGVPERQWHIKYGLIVRYFLPFGIERLIIADEEAIKNITVRAPYNYTKAPPATQWMSPILGGKGVLLVEGLEHAKQRRVLAPAFSTSAIRGLEAIFWDKGLLLAELLQKQRQLYRESNIEILDWMNRATLDIITSAAFNHDVDSLTKPTTPLRQAYAAVFAFDLVSVIVMGLRLFFGPARYLPLQMNRAMDASCDEVTEAANQIVKDHFKEGQETPSSSGKDIISLIMRYNESRPTEERLSFEEIRDQVKTFLGAGHDTTATGVAWSLELLSKHPDIQERLAQEITIALPLLRAGDRSDSETFADANVLDRLPYLSHVCQESLRFIPPVPIVSRVSQVDSHLGGYFIPAGTFIFISSNAINQLPHYWGADGSKFDPERWNQLPKNWTPNAYQTFLQGPRGCIGRRFAETEMKVFLCCLLSKFRFEEDETWPNQQERKMWRLVLRPKDGIRMKITRR